MILIIGGGLAGLSAARRLHADGIACQLHEARPRLGGRIFTVDASGEATSDGFDLGPSWFWPRMQPSMAALVAELGLAAFPQRSDGDIVFERLSREAPQRYGGMRQEPESMRLVGGTGALVTALASTLPAECLRLHSRLTHLTLTGDAVEARLAGPTGAGEVVRASHVVLAAPPRLLAATVAFSPALFGFVGIPAAQRRAMGDDAIVGASVRQLVTLFGPDAGAPLDTLFKDWAADALTATDDDATAGAHPLADDRPWVEGEWGNWMSLAGSETSPIEPGYLAGAVHAAERAVATVKRRLERR